MQSARTASKQRLDDGGTGRHGGCKMRNRADPTGPLETTMNNMMGIMGAMSANGIKKKGAPAPPKTKQPGLSMTVTMSMDSNLTEVGKK